MPFLHQSYFGNDVLSYFIAAAILGLGMTTAWIVKSFVLKALDRWAARTQTKLDNFLVAAFRSAALPLVYYTVIYFAFRSLTLNPALNKALVAVGTVLFTFIAVRFILQLVQFAVFDLWLSKRENAASEQRHVRTLMPIITVLVWTLGALFVLDNLGFKISTLVAGLGIGGVALALASQTVLGDMFSYFAIMLDRPFELDDFIILGDFMGTVEHIGIKTTRFRSLGGEQLVFSNKDLTDSRLRNYKRMELRRVVFTIGVAYETSMDKLRRAAELLKDAVVQQKNVRFDRAHFSSFEESQLKFEVVYYVLSADYNVYMDIQQAINLAIKEVFDKEGIRFAYPVRRVELPASVTLTPSSLRS